MIPFQFSIVSSITNRFRIGILKIGLNCICGIIFQRGFEESETIVSSLKPLILHESSQPTGRYTFQKINILNGKITREAVGIFLGQI